MFKSLAFVFIVALPVLGWAQGYPMSCEQRSENSYHGARIWHEMGRPGNLAANMLGLINGTGEHQLLMLTYAGLDAGASEAQTKQKVQAACEKIAPSAFEQEQSFFEENGNTPAYLTACANLLSAMFDLYSLPEQEIVRSIAVYPGPETAKWVSAVLSRQAQGDSIKKATETIFDHCYSSPKSEREALAKELYSE